MSRTRISAPVMPGLRVTETVLPLVVAITKCAPRAPLALAVVVPRVIHEADAGVDSGSNETNAVGFLGNTDVVTADAED